MKQNIIAVDFDGTLMREQVAGDRYAQRGAYRVSEKKTGYGEKLIL